MLQVGLQRSTKSVAASTSKPKGGLTKWFKEDWRDLKTGKKCGRKSAKGKSKRPYPSCRPKAVAQKMTAAEKRSSTSRKTGPAKIKHKVTASGKRRK
tara:strand:- start:321 stop:611 length:291 start_codon:yes stop_codon:yes gene_type:complete